MHIVGHLIIPLEVKEDPLEKMTLRLRKEARISDSSQAAA